MVIPEQPIEDFVLGLRNRFKAFSVQPFYFQRRKPCLAGRVIPAVALAAHRSGDAAFHKQAAELMAGVLAAAVTMEDMSRISVGTTSQPGCRFQLIGRLVRLIAHRLSLFRRIFVFI